MSNEQRLVLEYLDKQHITYELIEHEAVYTIEEMENQHIHKKALIVKNIFIRDDKKKQYFLVVLVKDKRINLKELRSLLDSRPLTFASENDLSNYLGLSSGAVSPLGILNDTTNTVTVIIDEDLKSFSQIGLHPNDNSATLFIALTDLITIIKDQGNIYLFMKL